MAKDKIPVTPGIRQLKDNKIDFIAHQYKYREKGGTAQTAEELKVDEHAVIKTLVFETSSGKLLILLMHGDREASVKELARSLGEKTVTPCDAKKAQNATGYQFGGTSPFGLRKALPVYAEASIFALPEIYINGGKQGLIVQIKPDVLKKLFDITETNVAV